MKLYLITGFLGAGKTTFLKNFIKQFASEKLFIIINEFGRIGVDGTLLREVNATLAEINNGSIFCSCRLDKFEETLENAVSEQPDVILVEASGLADPTNICKVLAQPRFSQIEYNGGVCLVDTETFHKVSKTANVCRKQISCASLALLNKADLATAEMLEQTMSLVNQINPACTVKQTVYGDFKAEWISLIKPLTADDVVCCSADITLQKACVTVNPSMSAAQLKSFLNMLSDCTYRMKGFADLCGKIYYADCVGATVNVTPYCGKCENIGQIVLLAGKGMSLRKSLKQAIIWYEKYIKEVRYD
ncbi:MAG: GTP-binding protein [Oscillospiraceae bacterium]